MSKKQWKTIDLSLQFSIKTDWSQEEVDSPLSDVNSIRSSLPTKTNATRQTAELDNIPENGPFILNFGNIPFDTTETDLISFFKEFPISNVEMNNPRRGCGHLEFTSINDLCGAWKMNDKQFHGRPIRLSIPLKEDTDRQQAMNTKRGSHNQQKPSTFNSDDSDDWRVKRPQTVSAQDTVSRTNDNKEWRARATPGTVSGTDDSSWRNRVVRNVAEVKEPAAWRGQGSRLTESRQGVEAVDKTAWSRGRGVRDTDGPRAEEGSDGGSSWRTRVSQGTEGETVWRGRAVVAVRDDACSIKDVTGVSSGRVAVTGHEESSSTSKKGSVFGEARPVDTTAKDKEIEAKIEHNKLTVIDALKPDPVTKPNAWANQKPSTNVPTVEKSNIPEWRDKSNVVPQINRLRLISSNQKEMTTAPQPIIVEESPKKCDRPLAPLPAVNVWEERKKSKTVGGGGGIVGGPSVVKKSTASHCVEEGRNADGHSVKEEGEKKVTVLSREEKRELGVSKMGEDDDDLVENQSYKNVLMPSMIDTKIAAPAVVSVNGPFIDPKNRRPIVEHSGKSNPTAVAVMKPATIISNKCVTKGDQQRQENVTTPLIRDNTVSTVGNKNSSWAQGPPRGLIESNSSNR